LPVAVSVVIVNYRAYTELAACLDSLGSHMDDGLEVVVVDHETNPPAAEGVRRRFPWIHLVGVDSNPGFAAGVNRGAATTSGRYLLLLNPDCVVHRDVARPLAAWLDAHPQAAACGAVIREVDGSVQPSARRFPGVTTGFAGRTSWLSRVWPRNPWTRRNLLAREPPPEPIYVDWVSGACMMVRRSAFDAIGGMDEHFFLYWEDADLCVRLKQAGWSTAYIPVEGVTHLTGRSSAHVPRDSTVAFHRSAYRYFRKHAKPLPRLLAPIVYAALRVRLLVKLVQLHLSSR
jgi:GT2 family glycosyltransferase